MLQSVAFHQTLHFWPDQINLVITNTVQLLYNTPHYSMDLDITWSCCGSQIFYHGILQRNYKKITIKWSFFYNFFVNGPFITPYGPKYSVKKGLHCTVCPLYIGPVK